MSNKFSNYLIAGIMFITFSAFAIGNDDKDEAIKKDLQQLEGTWKLVSLEIDGNKANEDDFKKLVVIHGPNGTWSLRIDGQELSKGTCTIDPTKKPKTIDFQPTEGGGERKRRLGIYETGDATRKVCFTPPGKDRPTEFSSKPGSSYVLVVFEREEVK